MSGFPRLARIHQTVPTAPLAEVAQTVREELRRIGVPACVTPGARIAVAAGSRGITDYAVIVRTVVEELQRWGAAPFVFPAMGSHGGATADGQRTVLAELGITAETMGCPVHSAMQVVQVGTTARGLPVFCDAAAYASDGIILVNRVKVHTDFHGPTESGLTKMLAIGLGKRQGAEAIHAHGVQGLRHDIPEVAAVQLAHSPILCGVAIVEDGAHHVSQIQAIPAQQIAQVEPLLLDQARQLTARLPVSACDLLIVEQMGKEISGAGMDNNVIGRMYIDGEPEPATPQIELIIVLRLSAASHGNATGIGFADLVTQQLIDAMDPEITCINIATSGFPRRGRIPPVLPTDQVAIAHALATLAQRGRTDPTVLRITNTLQLADVQVSKNLLPELSTRTGIRLLAAPQELCFRADGSLI